MVHSPAAMGLLPVGRGWRRQRRQHPSQAVCSRLQGIPPPPLHLHHTLQASQGGGWVLQPTGEQLACCQHTALHRWPRAHTRYWTPPQPLAAPQRSSRAKATKTTLSGTAGAPQTLVTALPSGGHALSHALISYRPRIQLCRSLRPLPGTQTQRLELAAGKTVQKSSQKTV